MRKLIVATSNPEKLKEIQNYLIGLDWKLQLKPDTLEIEETGATFIENACLKASQVAKILGEWVIADDSGLVVDALNGAPGLYSARYGATDRERIERLLRELGDTEQRQGQFVCAIAISRQDGSIALQAEGICHGEILTSPRGTEGFGYDPIFYVPQYQQTFAQMSSDTKYKVSHRGRAFEALLPHLSEI